MSTRPAMSLKTLLSKLRPDVYLVNDTVDVADTTIEWAHVSEMVDPTPWLRGGELLLLTGLLLPTDVEEIRDYVGRLRIAGVTALGISTGDSLAHSRIPPALIDAATAAGLPLLSIAEGTPLEKVVETVAAFAFEEQIASARMTARVQRALTRPIWQGAATDELLAVFEREFNVTALICSPAGSPLIAPRDAQDQRHQSLAEHAVAAVANMTSTLYAMELGTERVELHAVELEHQFVGAYVALTGAHPFASALRESLPLLVAAVSRALLPPVAGDPHHLAWRVECARWVFASSVPDAEVDARLVAAGYRDTLVRATTIVGDFAPDVGRNLARYYFENQCDVLLAHPRTGRVDCLLLNPVADLRVDQGVRGVAIALGLVTGQSSISRTVRSANAATRTPAFGAAPSHDQALQQLLTAVTVEDRAAFVRAVLGELSRAGGDLVETLRVYLDVLGAVEMTAARLDVHRHTVRHRLKRIAELAGRNPDDPRDRLLFALALAILCDENGPTDRP